MKKILFISDIGSPWGGSEELWSKAALILKKEGYNVYASIGWHGSIHPNVIQLKKAGISVIFRNSTLRTFIRKLAEYKNNSILKKYRTDIEKNIDKTLPDLIIFSQSHIFSAWQSMLYAKRKGIKYGVVTQLNSELSWANDNNYKTIRKAFLNADKCFFVSKGNLRLLEMQLAFALPNAEVISNPFNMDKIAELEWPDTSSLNFAFVGRLDFIHKGIDILLNSFANENWRKRNYQLNIYGNGDINLAKELANHLKVQNIIFHGQVNDIQDIWEHNHILVLASRYEGMPLVMIEAMFCKRTAIATDVAGHSELIIDGKTGFLADAPHTKLFTRKLEEVWNRKDELQQLGINAYENISRIVPEVPEVTFANHIKKLL